MVDSRRERAAVPEGERNDYGRAKFQARIAKRIRPDMYAIDINHSSLLLVSGHRLPVSGETRRDDSTQRMVGFAYKVALPLLSLFLPPNNFPLQCYRQVIIRLQLLWLELTSSQISHSTSTSPFVEAMDSLWLGILFWDQGTSGNV